MAWPTLSAGVAVADGTQIPDEAACRAAIEARLRSLQNLIVELQAT
jgi:hypothetical protein